MSEYILKSSYLDYLPNIYKKEDNAILNGLLTAFEDVFTGLEASESNVVALERILDKIYNYFSLDLTPDKFVDWLTSWVALNVKNEFIQTSEVCLVEKQNIPLNVKNSRDKKRALIKKLIKLYSSRGTLYGLLSTLKLYLGEKVEYSINDFPQYFEISALEQRKTIAKIKGTTEADINVSDIISYIKKNQHKDMSDKEIMSAGKVSSVVGYSTVVGHPRPHFFNVALSAEREEEKALLMSLKKAIDELIYDEKPAHTYCTIEV